MKKLFLRWAPLFCCAVAPKNIPFPVNTGATTSTDTNTRFNIGQADTRSLNVKPAILIHKPATSFWRRVTDKVAKFLPAAS